MLSSLSPKLLMLSGLNRIYSWPLPSIPNYSCSLASLPIYSWPLPSIPNYSWGLYPQSIIQFGVGVTFLLSPIASILLLFFLSQASLHLIFPSQFRSFSCPSNQLFLNMFT
uniref:Uncharacterized protein n=1 Tax=Cacopsylla melanoneura TaxID=428564 RepID=A0A8D9BIM8_9HEMI